ncbi:copper oxidase [Terrihabitans soli]|uniref:Copper oxidase n=1 Tax=Terrihabitans soli TaxID=708113 RepID=A0A6S6QWV2_9HYPH|nr:multicopper oxidase family protein [Terrihabitans soli]BCJ91510.1 copper oxidase [Terrihabitans soli]
MWTRRAFLGSLGAAGALALADSVSKARAAIALPEAPPVSGGVLREFELLAAEHKGGVIGKAAKDAGFWLYNNELFPIVRVKRGDTVRAHLKNRLSEHTSIHWHGIRVPNRMDGVQYVTQPPVKPGEDFTYEFTPPDTGTFFFHSHCNGVSQIGRGLAGILLVEGDEPKTFDDEYVLALKDWRLAENGAFLPFYTEEGAGRAGSFGTVRTVNGQESFAQTVPAGKDIRVRVLNLDPTRMIDLGVEGADAFVIATDGNPIEPFPLHTWRMGAAMRVDLQIRTPEAGKSFTVRDYFSSKPWALANFTAQGGGAPSSDFVPRPLYAPHIPKPDLADAERITFRFSAAAGAAASIDTGIPADNPLAKELMDSLCTGQRGFWAINKAQWPTGGHQKLPPPLALLQDGRTYIFELMNGTPHPHPIHLHGHTFEVVSASRQDLPRFLADTVVVQPKERIEIAFVAAKGDWMFHCHILEHQENGMMGWLRVA